MSGFSSPQSIKILLARGQAATDLVTGIADIGIKIPGTVGLNERTIEGGSGCFSIHEPGDYLTAEVRDDDNLLGLGAGHVLDSFHDTGVASGNEGWYFMGSNILHLHPIVDNDPTDLPSGMYLHIMGHKAVIPNPAHTLYINIHWGKRIR